MSENKSRIVNVFNNQPTDHIPVSFWQHFVGKPDFNGGKRVIPLLLDAHKKYILEISPDFVKIMSDGFHHHPSLYDETQPVKTADDLKKIKRLDKNHEWITCQVEIAKEVKKIDDRLVYFYNIFSPITHLRYIVGGEANLVNMLKENPQNVTASLDVIAQDLALLGTEILSNANIDGIYFSVANPNNDEVTDEGYKKYIEPSDLHVLNIVNAIKDFNILHICGHGGRRNHVKSFAHYHSKAVSWAVHEGVSLAEGKKIFGGRCVIGGFSTASGALLHCGKREEIEAEVVKIVESAGRIGVVISADCALPFGADTQRFKWIIEKARKIK